MKPPLRVLGIDTSLRSTGVGIVEAQGSRFSAIEYGALKISPKAPLSECLTHLAAQLDIIVERAQPQVVAIEGVFYSKNARTALLLGHARGVAIATCSKHGLPVYEYAPRRVKKAIVGVGSATKEQVRRMVVSILGLEESPREDAGDALAIALCHLHNKTGIAALMPERL